MNDQDKIQKVEEAILVMKDLLFNHYNHFEDYLSALEMNGKSGKNLANFDFKLNALIDSQIKNEIDIRNLKGFTFSN